jgi:hypothetical protein
MTNRNNPSTSDLAEEVRRRLERSTQAAAAPPSPDPVEAPRITKNGEYLAPGEAAPTGPDGQPVPHTQIPDATFANPGASAGATNRTAVR